MALDIDDENIRLSEMTVTANKLESRIQVKKTSPTDKLIPMDGTTGIEG